VASHYAAQSCQFRVKSDGPWSYTTGRLFISNMTNSRTNNLSLIRSTAISALLCLLTTAVLAAEPVASAPVAEAHSAQQLQSSPADADTDKLESAVASSVPVDDFRSLQQMDELTQIGMPGLAIRLITQRQAAQPEFSPDWYALEFKAIHTLASMQRWQTVIDRAQHVLDRAEPGRQITPRLRDWLRTQQSIAMLKLGKAQPALQQVRDMLWNSNTGESERIALWRRLLIRAYLQLNNANDAYKALLRYRQDYGDLNEEWKLLQARTLLRTRRPSEVVDLLAQETSSSAQALRLIAAIRARPAQIDLYIDEARQRLQQPAMTQADTSAYWYVLYEAAQGKGDTTTAITALQKLLLFNHGDELGEEFSVSADDLWKLYEQLGRQSGNRERLLLGDDQAWYTRAGELHEKAPLEAIGLYTVLAFSAQDEERRQLAHNEITGLLTKSADGLALINRLYLHSERVGAATNLPAGVRYSLVDYALTNGDTAPAAEMMASLPEPPAGTDAFDWKVRKARVLVMEGQHEAGVAVLAQALTELIRASQPVAGVGAVVDGVVKLKSDSSDAAPQVLADETVVSDAPAIDADKVDRYLQVVFDLQSIEQHTQALRLLDLLPLDTMDAKLQRELYYWKAESEAALEEHAQAAWLYLKSALTTDPSMSDLWAQSARFKAAEELTSAGLYDDAKLAYSDLLVITVSKSRKILIQQKLQQLRLLSNAKPENTK
jgi:hypothetical protein